MLKFISSEDRVYWHMHRQQGNALPTPYLAGTIMPFFDTNVHTPYGDREPRLNYYSILSGYVLLCDRDTAHGSWCGRGTRWRARHLC